MKNFFLILQMIPSIVSLVHVAEMVIPGAQQGKAKLDLVLSTVAAAAEAVPEIAHFIEAKDLEGAVTLITATTVAALNNAGVFTHANVATANA